MSSKSAKRNRRRRKKNSSKVAVVAPRQEEPAVRMFGPDASGDCVTSLRVSNPGKDTIEFICDNIPTLTSLDFAWCRSDYDAELQHLTKLSNLTHFWMSVDEECGWYSCNITDVGFQYISALTKLTKLNLDGCGITDASIQHIPRLGELRELHIRTGDTGLQFVAKLTNLIRLKLESCSLVTDVGVEHISNMANLTHLRLGSPKISDSAIALLANLEHLTTLELGDCDQITETGLLENLPKLKKLTSLDGCATLWRRPYLSEDSRAKLKLQMPLLTFCK